jgi:hypothetical protein
VLDRIGTIVTSETARIKVEFTDPKALECAVRSMSGQWIGNGSHRLYAGNESGYGFKLAGWTYPIVLGESGNLSYDTYKGQWGNEVDIQRLKGEYAIALAEVAAANLGWLTERVDGQLVVHHPVSGTMTITLDGVVSASGFQGAGCHAAIESLGLPLGEIHQHPEYAAVEASVQRS